MDFKPHLAPKLILEFTGIAMAAGLLGADFVQAEQSCTDAHCNGEAAGKLDEDVKDELVATAAAAPSLARKAVQMRHNQEMVQIPAGRFHMGDRKERVHFPQVRHSAQNFRVWLQALASVGSPQLITKNQALSWTGNWKFWDFVVETQYVTDAERLGDSFVAEVYLSDAVSATILKKVDAVPWWLPVPNASWRTPEGVDSGLDEASGSRFGDRWSHPAVHISWNDANAYCHWRNASLPTEAQWEYAARGGLEGMYYPWGDEMYGNETKEDEARYRMNIWQGQFPTLNTAEDGYIKTAPVDAFGPQNDWGLYNMVGNVWEWTNDWFSPVHFLTEENQATGFVDPEGPTEEELDELVERGYVKKDASGAFEKIKKGGSFMCHKSHCWRYRNCARHHLPADSTAHHIGLRCARAMSGAALDIE
ncbi:Formylglycine-generating enzyme (FGE) (C-alpha-formylglycine-generating enzyme 1) (Sulfatase-modifying factor 1) [Durusdinium trenchii]|uniref:Formylglycine-generating enzyme (FGE) (C-alpha-formylglycine-generating enzyme 1) (Sulfatase-modifying factor 1) n=1 Tax=Durusdinium trenchii TaxID=1381693 RepID=A0ABP0H682_9DINO